MSEDISVYQRLKRTVMACLLFEDNFYENGVNCVDRIKELCAKSTALQICSIALEAAQKYHLRHVPLLLIVEALKHKDKHTWFADTIYHIITRPDQLTDLLALYWKEGKRPLAYQLKQGLKRAFTKFDEHQLAKYNRDNPIKLRDVLFMVHAKPKDQAQAELWKRLVDKKLMVPDTWETRLSDGQDKKKSFHELLELNKMGKLAILRNLRNMRDAGVSKELVRQRLEENIKEMLPFQYLAAARECPDWEDIVDKSMIQASELKPKLKGSTLVMVDVSGSMDAPISLKSKMMRFDAACGLAILLRECCENLSIVSFSDQTVQIPPRQGMALRDAIVKSQGHSGTYIGQSLYSVYPHLGNFSRIIIITDEQSQDVLPIVPTKLNYILNVGCYQNGIGTRNQWTTISGFSESSIDFIREFESI